MDFKPPNRFNNLFNPNMNNITSIDYSNHTLTSDFDGCLPRWSGEFPRISSKFRSKADLEHKPWGSKSDPVYIDLWEDSKLLQLHSCSNETTLSNAGVFEKGIWYYSGMPMTDHHELAGIENPNRVMQTCLGTEFRPQVYINIFNRLLLLEFNTATPSRQMPCCLINKETSKDAVSDFTVMVERKTQATESDSPDEQ